MSNKRKLKNDLDDEESNINQMFNVNFKVQIKV